LAVFFFVLLPRRQRRNLTGNNPVVTDPATRTGDKKPDFVVWKIFHIFATAVQILLLPYNIIIICIYLLLANRRLASSRRFCYLPPAATATEKPPKQFPFSLIRRHGRATEHGILPFRKYFIPLQLQDSYSILSVESKFI
jgi:hypothetical protein